MSKKRLIPKLQLKSSGNKLGKLVLVVTKQFEHTIEIGDPVSQAKIYEAQVTDELIFVNIDRFNKSIDSLAMVIKNISDEIFMPLSAGGGVKSVQDFRTLLSSGADKIVVNTEAIKNPILIEEASKKFGSQCVVVSIDYKKNKDGINKVYMDNGKTETSYDVIEWAKMCEELGAGEILITSIDRDGMRNGLDIQITHELSDMLSIPVIIGGGCGVAAHFSEAFINTEVSAVTAGTFFAQRDQNFIQTRAQIKNSGINIR